MQPAVASMLLKDHNLAYPTYDRGGPGRLENPGRGARRLLWSRQGCPPPTLVQAGVPAAYSGPGRGARRRYSGKRNI
jgi:hypothetical protein